MTLARTLWLLLVASCATPASALRQDNRRLSQTVTDLRTDRRAQDRRLRDLQHQVDELRARTAGDVGAQVPVLPVEIAAPDAASSAPPPPAPGASRVVGVAEDGTEIVYEGEAIARPAAALVASDQDTPRPRRVPAGRPVAPLDIPATATTERLEVTRHVPAISTVSARGGARARPRDHDPAGDHAGDAAVEYRAAVELVKAQKFDDAVAALRAFIAHYPRHDYADNAQYWLGEAFYAQKDYPHALTEFRRVVEVYPRGNKVPDALLKVGYCYQATGQGDKARAVLEQVVNTYPRSEPATLAAKRLEAP